MFDSIETLEKDYIRYVLERAPERVAAGQHDHIAMGINHDPNLLWMDVHVPLRRRGLGRSEDGLQVRSPIFYKLLPEVYGGDPRLLNRPHTELTLAELSRRLSDPAERSALHGDKGLGYEYALKDLGNKWLALSMGVNFLDRYEIWMIHTLRKGLERNG